MRVLKVLQKLVVFQGTLDSFMGYKRSDMDGNVVYVDAPYKVYGFSIQYRRYLTTAAKREREEAV